MSRLTPAQVARLTPAEKKIRAAKKAWYERQKQMNGGEFKPAAKAAKRPRVAKSVSDPFERLEILFAELADTRRKQQAIKTEIVSVTTSLS